MEYNYAFKYDVLFILKSVELKHLKKSRLPKSA